MKNVYLVILLILGGLAFATSTKAQKKGEAWDVPAKYVDMKNPHVGDAASIKKGKGIYMRFCRACHGNKGLGDGPKAARLKTFPGDFSSEEFLKNTDGQLYFMGIIGRKEMPNYEKKIVSEKDRWAVINYMRSLKK